MVVGVLDLIGGILCPPDNANEGFVPLDELVGKGKVVLPEMPLFDQVEDTEEQGGLVGFFIAAAVVPSKVVEFFEDGGEGHGVK